MWNTRSTTFFSHQHVHNHSPGVSGILGASAKLQKATVGFMFVFNGTISLSLDTFS
jgi:hypothetical protein